MAATLAHVCRTVGAADGTEGTVRASFDRKPQSAMSFADLLAADDSELEEHYPTRAEHTADGLVHAVGILLGLIGGAALFAVALTHGGMALSSAVALYALCIVLMMASSAIYNLTRPSPARRVLRRLDEAAIFLAIAGSYTPFVIALVPDANEVFAVSTIWAAALAGAAGKVLLPQITDRAWCFVYLAFAWVSVALVGPTALQLPLISLILLAAGGAIYSLGVLIYLNHALPYRRAIWHGMVVMGAAAHYAAIFTGVVMPGF